MKIAGISCGGFYIGDRLIAEPTHADVRELIARQQVLTPAQADFLIRYAALMAQQAAKPAPKPRRRK